MAMNKRGETSPAVWIGLLVLVLYLTGAIGGTTTPTTPPTPDAVGGTTVTTVLCPDTQKKIFVQALDNNAAATTRVGGTVRVYDDSGNLIGSQALSTSAYSSGLSVCTQGKEYEAILFNNATGNVASARGKFIVGYNDAYLDLNTNQLDNLQARVVYDDNGQDAFLGAGNTYSTNSTAFTDVNTTLVGTNLVGGDKAIGASETLEFTVSVKAETSRKFHGDKTYKEFLCIDQGTGSVWAEPTVSRPGQAPLADAMGMLSPSDLTYSNVKASEYCYEIGTPVPNSAQSFAVTQPARSGQNPTTSDDIVLYFLSQGLYQSVEQATSFDPMVGIATDATTQALVVHNTKYLPRIDIEIS